MNSLYALAALFVAAVAAQDSLSASIGESIEFSPNKLVNDVVSAAGLTSNVHDGPVVGNVQVVSNLAHHRCVQTGHVTTIFEGMDVMKTPLLLKSIDRQLEVAFFVPSSLLLDATVIANAQAALRKNHTIGLRFNPAYDSALSTLTDDVVNAQLATAEVQFKKNFGRNLQYVLFAHGTPASAYKVAEKRFIRPVLYNVDFSQPNANYIATLDANFINPKAQSFITLQSAHTESQDGKDQWGLLRDTHNGGYARGFQSVRLSTCVPPLRESGVEVQVITNNNPANTPPIIPQPLTDKNSASSTTPVKSALIGFAIALALLVLA